MERDNEELINNQFLWISKGICIGAIIGVITGALLNNVISIFIILTSLGGIAGYMINELNKKSK